MSYYLFSCLWCGSTKASHYKGETCCLDCGIQLMDRTHHIYNNMEAEELSLNEGNHALYKLVDSADTYIDALKKIRETGDIGLENFLGGGKWV